MAVIMVHPKAYRHIPYIHTVKHIETYMYAAVHIHIFPITCPRCVKQWARGSHYSHAPDFFVLYISSYLPFL